MGSWEGVGCLLRSQSREGFLGEGEEDVSVMPWWFNLLARLITVLVYEASPGLMGAVMTGRITAHGTEDVPDRAEGSGHEVGLGGSTHVRRRCAS